MATNLFGVLDKYFDILTWNMIFFIQKMLFCAFFQILHQIDGFFIILLNSVARECVTMVANHTVTF